MSWDPPLLGRRDTLALMTTLPSPQDRCPCCSGAPFGGCCAPILAGEAAPNALALMRSRYSAYVLGDEDHLFRSWHPKTRPTPPLCDPRIEWLGLQIVNVDGGGEEDSEGIVEFIASWRSPSPGAGTSSPGAGSPSRSAGLSSPGVESMRESSRFLRRAGRWVYVDGDIR